MTALGEGGKGKKSLNLEKSEVKIYNNKKKSWKYSARGGVFVQGTTSTAKITFPIMLS